MANFILGGLAYDAYLTGIKEYPWYYSDWGGFLTMGYWILLILQYCASDYDTTYFDFLVGTMFEVVLTFIFNIPSRNGSYSYLLDFILYPRYNRLVRP